MILGNLEPQRCCWKWCSWATFRLINSGGLGRLQALTIKSTNGLKTPNCKRYLFLTKGRILGFPEKHHHKHTRIYILRFKTEVKPVPGIYIMWYVLIILMIVLFWLFFLFLWVVYPAYPTTPLVRQRRGEALLRQRREIRPRPGRRWADSVVVGDQIRYGYD